MTTQRVSLCSTPCPRHRPPSRRRIANDWHSTHTSAPFVSRLGQPESTSSLFLPTDDDLEQDRRTAVSSNCIQYLRYNTNVVIDVSADSKLSHGSSVQYTKSRPYFLNLTYTRRQKITPLTEESIHNYVMINMQTCRVGQ